MSSDPGRCPLSNTWALRGYTGVCVCGRKVRVKNTGKLAEHKKLTKRLGVSGV